MTFATQSVERDGRFRLPYIEQGAPAGEPVLMLHGFTDSWRSFERVLPHLPPDLRAIALTQRGHGDAGRPEHGYMPQDFADDAAAVLDALGIEKAIVVGHCMGGQIALQMAQDHPDRVRGLVLISGFASMGRNTVVRALWDDAVADLRDPIDPSFVEEFQRSTVACPVPEAFIGTIVRESLKVPARVWRAALRGTMDADLTSGLRHIAVPTLLLWGDQDAIVPRADQETLLAAIPDAWLAVFGGTGHSPHWEDPADVAERIAAFARGFPAR